jgi:hypothetical protein
MAPKHQTPPSQGAQVPLVPPVVDAPDPVVEAVAIDRVVEPVEPELVPEPDVPEGDAEEPVAPTDEAATLDVRPDCDWVVELDEPNVAATFAPPVQPAAMTAIEAISRTLLSTVFMVPQRPPPGIHEGSIGRQSGMPGAPISRDCLESAAQQSDSPGSTKLLKLVRLRPTLAS